MNVVWQKGQATVQEVCDALERDLAYSTVKTTLKILHKTRGVVKRFKRGRAFVYEATASREEIARSVTQELKKDLYQGSVKSLVLNLLEGEDFTSADLAELKAAIREIKAMP